MRCFTWLAASLCTILLPSAADASNAQPFGGACTARIEPRNQQNVLNYDPLSVAPLIGLQEFDIVNTGTEDCVLRVTLLAGATRTDEARGETDTLKVQWLDEANRVLAMDNGIGVGRSIRIAAGATRPFRAQVVVRTGQLVDSGGYRNLVNLQFIQAGDPARNIVAEFPLDISFSVPPVLGLSFAGVDRGSSVAKVDFGELETGEARVVIFRAIANADYQMAFVADNAGRLKHESLAAFVPYTFTVNGNLLDLSQEATINAEAQERRIVNHRVVVRVGKVEGQPAGRYRDLVQLRISPWR